MIRMTYSGDFRKTRKLLGNIINRKYAVSLEKYAQEGVKALSEHTPKDTGLTAASWGYEISQTNGKCTITWTNNNIAEYIPVAILIQYGHATKSGYYIQGVDYINPALQPIFSKIAEKAWREVTSK